MSLLFALLWTAPEVAASEVRLSFDGVSSADKLTILGSQLGQRVEVTLRDGAKVSGELIAALPTTVFVAVAGSEIAVEIALDRVSSFARWSSRPPAVDGRSQSGRYLGLQTITLLDGRAASGVVVRLTKTDVHLVVEGGARIGVPRARIAEMTPSRRGVGVGARPDAGVSKPPLPSDDLPASSLHRSRHFVLRSAKPLGKWEGYVSQKELGYSEFSLGVSDHISIYAGAVLPAWFVGAGSGLHIVLGAQGGLQVAPDLYWAASLHGAVLPNDIFGGQSVAGALNFGTTLTWGPDNLHASLGVLVPLVFTDERSQADLLISLAAAVEVADWLALMTEHSVSPMQLADEGSGLPGVHMAGFRVMYRDWSVDLAAVYFSPLSSEIMPLLPWLDVTYRWGTPPAVSASPEGEAL